MASEQKTQAEVLVELLLMPIEHSITDNSRGGYDCTCGASWDWTRVDKLAADSHVAQKRAELLLAAGVWVETE